MELGLIDRDTQVQPQSRGFNKDLQLSPGIRDQNLRSALLSDLGSAWEFVDEILKFKD
jgi:hypothetical protein